MRRRTRCTLAFCSSNVNCVPTNSNFVGCNTKNPTSSCGSSAPRNPGRATPTNTRSVGSNGRISCSFAPTSFRISAFPTSPKTAVATHPVTKNTPNASHIVGLGPSRKATCTAQKSGPIANSNGNTFPQTRRPTVQPAPDPCATPATYQMHTLSGKTPPQNRLG